MSRIVVDVSIALAWFLDDETDAYANEMFSRLERGDEAAVPCLWCFELANALVVSERSSRLTRAETARILADAQALPLTIDATTPMKRVVPLTSLARDHGLSAYDAAYLELAMRLSAPLATLDRPLRTAARRLGIPDE